MRKLLIGAIALVGWLAPSVAQERPKIKFGNVDPADFKPTIYSIDSNATAVVIADIGSTEIEGNNKGSFSLLFKRYFRAHILNKNGYGIGNIEIPLYTSGDNEEELENLKAVTYNMENGKVVSTKLDIKGGVFKDQFSKRVLIKKFTFPNLHEGSIIEFEYRIKSDFIFHLQPWDFQGEYPRLWSEYNVAMPTFYTYVNITQGYHPYVIKDQKSRQGSFTLSDTRGAGATEREAFNSEVIDYRWAMKDVPALKEESYTSTLKNHIARIEFQLSFLGYPFQPKQVLSTYPMVTKDLLEDEEFGAQLKKDNGWLNDVMGDAAGKETGLGKAQHIYAWVRDNFTCTSRGGVYLKETMKNVLKSRKGSAAEINLLLVAMLRKAGLTADPVILGTRDHGYTHPIYPMLDRFNHVICLVWLDGKVYYLDASEARMGFGKLGYECYNGQARVVNTEALPVELNSDFIKEEKFTSVFVVNDDKGNWIGSINQTPGYFESTRIRNSIKEKGKDQYFDEIKKELGTDLKVSNTRVDSLEKYDDPVGISYDIDLKNEREDIIYFNPMFGEGMKENPFKSAQRFYPVEMPYTIDETFNLQLEVPTGYSVDELPKQAVVKFNEQEDAIFEYRISISGNIISMRSKLVMKKAFFQPDEYEVLREFFNLIVKKHSEQIVFKKKK